MSPGSSLGALLPELLLAGTAIGLLAVDAVSRRSASFCLGAGLLASLAALGAMGLHPADESLPFGGQLGLDGLAAASRLLTLFLLVVTLLVSLPAQAVRSESAAEYTALLLFAATGLSGLAAARHWLVLFVFLETASLSFATLLGARRDDPAAREASLKYFILSAFASAFLLYGVALLFRSTGSFALGAPVRYGPSDRVALCLIGAGLAFKCALVPFHMWAPDVYQGGPAPVIGFMAAASKAAGFVVLGRVLLAGGAVSLPGAPAAVAAVAGASVVTGTLLALTQRDLRRMLAFSGVAHAGYAATAFLAGAPEAVAALMVYLGTYAIMTIGTFTVVGSLEQAGVPAEVPALTGLARRAPVLALALAVFMVSLTGLPPTAGFVAKFSVFREAIAGGWVKLVVLVVLMSVVSVGFYLRLLIPVYMEAGDPDAPPLHAAPEGWVTAAFLAVLLVVTGLFPNLLLAFGGLTGAS